VALSYVWGNAQETRPIVVNGIEVQVTDNLEAALQEIRRFAESPDSLEIGNAPASFWIDAISINQSDNAEESHQVRRMGEIFAQATSVIVWLGIADEESRTACNEIRMFASSLRTLDFNSTNDLEEFFASNTLGGPPLSLFDDYLMNR
jgi:hypothetical protein